MAAAAARRSARSRGLQRAATGRMTALGALDSSPGAVGGGQTRGVCASRLSAAGKKPAGEASEALLAQQMMDFIRLAEEEEQQQAGGRAQQHQREAEASVDPAAQALLPVTGAVTNLKSGIASISGLRHATIGSVVAVHDAAAGDEKSVRPDAEPICRGLVLFLEKKVAHVALLGDQSGEHTKRVQIGMHVTLESAQLTIPGSLARLSGAVVDPLGVPQLEFAGQGDAADALASANERIPIAWGSKTVPGLMQRAPLSQPFETGVLAIDCLKPMAMGHRVGVLGPRNSGKTRVALDVIVHQVEQALEAQQTPPHFVYVCVAKSATRTQQIVQYLQDKGALPYTTVVAADVRDSLVMQYIAPFTGCAVAEFFMNHGESHRSVVVYDDLAAHMMVVESLVHTMKLPRIAQLSLSAHAVLMERSAQFSGAEGKSLTTLVLADAPDNSTGEVSEFKERVSSIVDDCIYLESSLARQRIYPAVNVLAPGASIRGPPFQSAALWKFMNALRPLINEAARTKENVDVARKLGFEVEPEDAERLEFLELVQQYFTQTPGAAAVSQLERELGAFLLTILQLPRLPSDLSFWDFVSDVAQTLKEQSAYADVWQQLESHSHDKPWSADLQANVESLLLEVLNKTRKEQRERQKQLLMGEIKRQQEYQQKLRQMKQKRDNK